MKLSQQFYRLLPMFIALAAAAACGCASDPPYGASRPYRAPQTPPAGQSPLSTAPAGSPAARPAARTTQPSRIPAGVVPPATSQTQWDRPNASPASATSPPVDSSPASASPVPATGRPRQAASYRQPAQSTPPPGGASASAAPGSGQIQQMSYESPAGGASPVGGTNPFSEVEGQSAGGAPDQYAAPPTGSQVPTSPPASGATPSAGSAPYSWGAPPTDSSAEGFMPPIQQ